jgi:arsenate reductase-like glutaredoxin family protein
LSQKLPTIAFDIDQSGNVRKADEAEAMYISIQVAHILKEKSFKEELQRIAKEYDFGNIKSLANDQIGFRELLKDW